MPCFGVLTRCWSRRHGRVCPASARLVRISISKNGFTVPSPGPLPHAEDYIPHTVVVAGPVFRSALFAHSVCAGPSVETPRGLIACHGGGSCSPWELPSVGGRCLVPCAPWSIIGTSLRDTCCDLPCVRLQDMGLVYWYGVTRMTILVPFCLIFGSTWRRLVGVVVPRLADVLGEALVTPRRAGSLCWLVSVSMVAFTRSPDTLLPFPLARCADGGDCLRFGAHSRA